MATETRVTELERISLAASPEIRRTLDALTLHRRLFNRSLIVREAIIEKADRELPAGWREEVGIKDEDAA